MRLQHGLAFGFAVMLVAGTALAKPAHRPAAKPDLTPSIPPSAGALANPTTLTQALSAAYLYNPALQAARAQLRATDEQVPQALAGWRPTVTLTGSVGYGDGTSRAVSGGEAIDVRNNRDILTGAASVTQPLYRGGRTVSQTHQAKNNVMSQRARLIASEEQTLTNTVNAYVGVIQAEQVLQLNINNEQVLAKQLQATRDRFRVGEITRTDVAQAEAALAAASATRQTAEGNLQTARATFQQTVGVLPGRLTSPQPLQLPVRTEDDARRLATENNPNVVAALFADAAAKDAVDVAFSALMPSLNVTGTAFRQDNSTIARQRSIGGQALLNLSVPIYQGGAEYSAVRQAKQTEQQQAKGVDDARRTALAQAVQAWETLQAARNTIDSTRAAIRANQVALDGVEREAIVGSRTTQDVLNAQQTLLNSEITLVQNLAAYINASYGVAAAVGRLTARDLRLPVPYYDDTAYYDAVKDKLWGVNDAATDQPGR